ncbi:MAG: hypothetical protein KDC95_15315, partial [Planctomycetes bacterium]|nr:hypothetical protein [Planctomycetota bacterium]
MREPPGANSVAGAIMTKDIPDESIRGTRKPDLSIESVRIPKPCSADWDSMEDRGSQRYCEACNLCVHDVRRLTESETRDLLRHAAQSGTRVCMRVTYSADGSVVTRDAEQDIPTRRRFLSRAWSAAAAILAVVTLGACKDPKQPGKGGTSKGEPFGSTVGRPVVTT